MLIYDNVRFMVNNSTSGDVIYGTYDNTLFKVFGINCM